MASYFKNISSLAELKKVYRAVAMKNHPDMGGSEEVMKNINIEYEVMFNILSTRENVHESARHTISEFYTRNGWKGDNYCSNLSNKDIAKRIREFVKKAFPKCRFSVTSNAYDICVYLMKGDFNPFVKSYDRKYTSVNQYYIDDADNITDYAKSMMRIIDNFIRSYRYDDSDSSVDYFDTNFYYNLGIGTCLKKYVQTGDTDYSACQEVML